MLKEFKKYDKEHFRVTDVPICEINRLLSENNIKIKILYPYEEKSESATISIEDFTGLNLPANIIVGKFFDIRILDWYWNKYDCYSITIEYIPNRNNQ